MGERTKNVLDGDIGQTLKHLSQVIAQRASELPEASYTTTLLKDPNLARQKVIEEAHELAEVSGTNDHDHIRYEAADLLYHTLVLLQTDNITLEELAGELNARSK